MSEHILLVEAGAASQPASLEFLLQERLPSQLSAGQKAQWGAHSAALQLLHFHRARIRPALLLFSLLHPGHLLTLWGRCGALLGLHYGGYPAACWCRRYFAPPLSSRQSQQQLPAPVEEDLSLPLAVTRHHQPALQSLWFTPFSSHFTIDLPSVKFVPF